ncbi:uncharacterized protein LOC133814904 [Humulus lupulus]|uniref:uncharacterized protein LOC133814904 n=1 Tax=Humulus lupulus TaxID=3486 RepID=UPI002B417186|nr:uncharacterized protein LOC133814904 [Humulus lupulus]
MLCTVALDANNHLFPIAFRLVDNENHTSWTFFIRKLKEAIRNVDNLAFILDKHASITHALEVVFPDAYHGACCHHVCMNVVAKFKTDHYHDMIWCATYAFRKTEFHKFFEKIKDMDPPIAKYLQEIGLDRWNFAYFPRNRYNIMTSNYAESYTDQTKEAKTFLVTTFLEFICFTLYTWFTNRREKAAKETSVLAPLIEADLKEIGVKANFVDVQVLGHHDLLVVDGNGDGEVNLVTNSCSCGMFQTIGIPCVHAFAAARKRSINIYSLCSPYYTIESWMETYKETIYPCGNEDEWILHEQIKEIVVGVRVEKNHVGRPKKKKLGRLKTKRFPSNGEHVVQPRTSAINLLIRGHYRLQEEDGDI